jgi:hypothetical protein
VDNEGNRVLIFLVVHQTGISTALLSCTSPLVKAGEQLPFGGLHSLCGGGVTLGSGRSIHGLDSYLRLRYPATPGKRRSICQGVAYQRYTRFCLPLLLVNQLGLPTRPMKV